MRVHFICTLYVRAAITDPVPHWLLQKSTLCPSSFLLSSFVFLSSAWHVASLCMVPFGISFFFPHLHPLLLLLLSDGLWFLCFNCSYIFASPLFHSTHNHGRRCFVPVLLLWRFSSSSYIPPLCVGRSARPSSKLHPHILSLILHVLSSNSVVRSFYLLYFTFRVGQ